MSAVSYYLKDDLPKPSFKRKYSVDDMPKHKFGQI